jgi:hypothetical protein
MNMPWYMGCCCVNLCAARNLLRYQNRIRGNDLVEECGIPYGLKCVGDLTQGIFPFVWCIIYGVFVAATMQQLQEVQTRASLNTVAATGTGGGGADRYLSSPPGVMIYPSTATTATVTTMVTSTSTQGQVVGGIEFIQPTAVSMTSPLYRSSTPGGGYPQVNNPMVPSPTTPSYAIGRPLSEKEV